MKAQRIGNGHLRARVPAPFAALMLALQLQGADTKLLRLLREEEWRELLPLMDRARLTLPLAQESLSCLPGWVHERLESNVADVARHWKHVQAAYREAAATLDANGVNHLVLKGFTQAPDFVPRPELRRQCDVDFYVPPEYIPAAVRSLQEIGYAACHPQEDYRYADHVPTLVRFGTWKWQGHIYDPEVPPAIEVHFCMWNDSVSSITIRDVEQFWKRRRIRTLGELVFPALHAVDHLGYFSLHILRNVFNGESPVHHVRELATFLNKPVCNDAFWREWALMHSQRFRSMQTVAFSLAVAWFSCNVPDAIEAEMDRLPTGLKNWIGTCGCSPLEALFRRTRDGRLLQFLLAETAEARKRILWKALTPGHVFGPEGAASSRMHPSTPARPNPISSYLAYPAYICNRVWINGSAVVRFLANAGRVQVSPRRDLARDRMGRVLRTQRRV